MQAETQANERITYIHTDALGSPVLGTDPQGNVVWREDYQPYGERFLGEAANTRRLYTGKYEETSTGLVDFGGRWYNPEIGRFYSVDPQGFEETNPHSFNRYAYANDNPYRYVDPDGRDAISLTLWGVMGALTVVDMMSNTPVPGHEQDGIVPVIAIPGPIGLGSRAVKTTSELAEQAVSQSGRKLGDLIPGQRGAIGESPPILKQIHSKETLTSGSNRYGYDY